MSGWLPWYRRLKEGLSTVAGAVLAAPLKLPPKVVAGARYVALVMGLLDALEAGQPDQPPTGEEEEGGPEEPPHA